MLPIKLIAIIYYYIELNLINCDFSMRSGKAQNVLATQRVFAKYLNSAWNAEDEVRSRSNKNDFNWRHLLVFRFQPVAMTRRHLFTFYMTVQHNLSCSHQQPVFHLVLLKHIVVIRMSIHQTDGK